MVSFVLIFNYLQKLYFSKWVFFYSLKCQSTNTIFLCALKQVCHFYKVLLLQQGGFVISNTFWHFYSLHINLSIQHFYHGLWYSKLLVPCFYHCSSMDRTLFHEYPSSKPMLSFGAHATAISGIGVSSQLFFTPNRASLVFFYKLSLYRTPCPYGVSLGPGLTP